jgi:hypothetical protein
MKNTKHKTLLELGDEDNNILRNVEKISLTDSTPRHKRRESTLTALGERNVGHKLIQWTLELRMV